ncbi:MAG: aldo/keto reductase [Ignavibacteria bacterium]|jgi:aryl-alcohol dehydrogenase-like predicted oxidoreductase
MNYRSLGRTGYKVSEISFGAWAIGGNWGDVDDKDSIKALYKAVEMGVNFFDTADVYGDGRSERLLSKLRKDFKDKIIIATKAGRRLEPHVASGYNRKNLTAFIERSLANLDVDALDLVQLHCPPTEVYYMPETFGILDDLVNDGKIKYYGVSVEKVEEALKAIEYPNVQSVQIIFNMFRLRPADLFFTEAMKKQVGILARVPLSSGMLTGKITKERKFSEDDHRNFNRDGEAFDKGETFSGVNFEKSLETVEQLKSICPGRMSMTQFALKWILMFEAVTCAIPGAKREEQALENFSASGKDEIPLEIMNKVKDIYDKNIKQSVHHYW